MTEFREVLHAWAAQFLDEKSGHIGPFEIHNVWITHSESSSISSEELSVDISFDHPAGCTWSADYLAKYGLPPCSGLTTSTLPGRTA